MLKAEFHYLLKNKLMLIVLAVVLFIPSIYAGTFLASMWDPYGQLDHLPVAIVDNDHPATMNGKTLKIGQQISTDLVKQQALKFRIVSTERAQAGLKSGKYYAVYTIPSDFSHNATTLLSSSPRPMQLKLQTSNGHNLTAGKMASGAATSIQIKLNGQIASTYAKVLVSDVTQLGNGLHQATSGSKALTAGAQQINTGADNLNTNLRKLASGFLQLTQGSHTLSTGIGSYVSAVSDMETGTTQLATGLNTINDQLPMLGTGLSQLQSGSRQLTQGLQSSSVGLSQLQDGADTLYDGLQQYRTKSSVIATKSTMFAQQLDRFATQLNVLLTSGNQDARLQQLATLIKATQTALHNMNASQVTTTTAVSQAIAEQARTLHLTSEQIRALQQTTEATIAANTGKQADVLMSLLTQLQQLLPLIDLSAQEHGKMSVVFTQMTSAAHQLASANTQLTTASDSLVHGSQVLTEGLGEAVSGNQQLKQSVGQLNAGLINARSKAGALTNGISTLSTGANTLNMGVKVLNSKGIQLNTGALHLMTSLDAVNMGTAHLADGGETLQQGISDLAQRTTQLSTKLSGANGQLPHLQFSAKQSKAFASPVELQTIDNDTVPNNGTSMAPYMLAVSLYVGAMIVNLMFDAYTPRKRPTNGLSWWASKAVVMDGVAVLSATVVLAILTRLNHLTPVAMGQTWLVLVLASVAFMTIITWLNLLLGRTGSFFAMILLVIQLSGSAGTYPIELSNHFFEVLHPFLPMSYVVSGLRETIMIGGSAVNAMLILFSIIVIFSFFNIVHYSRFKARMTEMDFEED